MARGLRTFVPACTAALLAAAVAQAAPRSGVYSNVCYSPETFDLAGVAIQFSADNPPAGVFWLCEGGCGWPAPMAAIRVADDAIAFTVVDESVDAQGKTVSSHPYHYRGRFTPGGLTLTSDNQYFGRQVLQRRRGETPTLARRPEAGRNWRSGPKAVRRCR